MSSLKKYVEKIFNVLLSEETRTKTEHAFILVAVLSFVVHLLLIFLVDLGWIENVRDSALLTDPIAAIYTPFSFILLYEVYLLIFYLPKSISNYIVKQYEIITLIVIRRIFKDLANLEMTPNWFKEPDDLQFTYDIITTLILFFLIYLFYKMKSRYAFKHQNDLPKRLKKFIYRKKIIAIVLAPTFIAMAVYSLWNWIYENFISVDRMVNNLSDINDIFFDEFFTLLILTDVLLLLLSFFNTDLFYKIIRNSGFIISTILIRLSFTASGALNNALIVMAVLFGVLILYLHNSFDRYNASLREEEREIQEE
ncbi:hypothetical protein GCM10009117_13360 [Gangjinia marincola]|uniref:Uncharacterized protein n=1 Tax=Gangjinia marincola TaxID=578463 RepID=A0ABP3XUZ1_9FLAO